jgi:hypothetical protein
MAGGIGFDWQLATRLSLQGVYSANAPQILLTVVYLVATRGNYGWGAVGCFTHR